MDGEFGYDGIRSLFAVFAAQPAQLKNVVDDLLVAKTDSKETVMRTVFLYFFQLTGIASDDHATLKIMFDFIEKKLSSGGKPKEMTKEQQDSLKFDVDAAAILGQGKLAQLHLRHFKKFCKLFVANLVDLFPAKKDVLIDIIREVCNLTRLKVRIARYAFTCIGMHLLKHLLA